MTEPAQEKHDAAALDEMPEMDVYSGVRWSAVSKYGAQGMQVVVSLVLARLLAPEYFGLLAMATVVTGFVRVFRNLGFNAAIIQRKTVSGALLSTLFWANLAVCLLVGGVVVAVSPAAAWMYHDARVAPIIAVLALDFVFAGFTMIPAAVLTRRMAFNKLAVCEILSTLFSGTTAITLAVVGFGVWALVAGSLAGAASRMMLINLVCPFRPRLVFDAAGLKECLAFGLNLTGFSIFNYFARNADNLIIGVFLGPVALGYYALAYRLMLLPRDSVSQVVTRVLFPAFSRMQDDDERLANAYLRACGAIAFVTFPMMAGLAVVAHPFVQVVLGDKWLPAVPLIWILAPLGMVQSITTTTGQLYIAKGRPQWMFRLGILGGTLHLCGFLVGVSGGVLGICLAYCVTSAAMLVVDFTFVFRLLPPLSFARLGATLGTYAAHGALMAGAVLLCRTAFEDIEFGPQMVLAASVALGVVVYCATVLWLRPPAVSDILAIIPEKAVSRRGPVNAERVDT